MSGNNKQLCNASIIENTIKLLTSQTVQSAIFKQAYTYIKVYVLSINISQDDRITIGAESYLVYLLQALMNLFAANHIYELKKRGRLEYLN